MSKIAEQEELRASADAKLRELVDRVAQASGRARADALAALRKEVQAEEARARRWVRVAVVAIAEDAWPRVVTAAKGSDEELRTALASFACELADAVPTKTPEGTPSGAPDRVGLYAPHDRDVQRVREAITHRTAGAKWGAAFVSLRTGALERGPLDVDAATFNDELKRQQDQLDT